MKDVPKHSVCNYSAQFIIPMLLAMKIINMNFKLNPQETYASKMPLTPKFDARESEIMRISKTLVYHLHLYVCSSKHAKRKKKKKK